MLEEEPKPVKRHATAAASATTKAPAAAAQPEPPKPVAAVKGIKISGHDASFIYSGWCRRRNVNFGFCFTVSFFINWCVCQLLVNRDALLLIIFEYSIQMREC